MTIGFIEKLFPISQYSQDKEHFPLAMSHQHKRGQYVLTGTSQDMFCIVERGLMKGSGVWGVECNTEFSSVFKTHVQCSPCRIFYIGYETFISVLQRPCSIQDCDESRFRCEFITTKDSISPYSVAFQLFLKFLKPLRQYLIT